MGKKKNNFLFYAVSNLGSDSFPTYQLVGYKAGCYLFSGKIFGYTRNKCNHSRQNSNVLLGTPRGTRLKYPLTYFNKGWAVGAVQDALAKFP